MKSKIWLAAAGALAVLLMVATGAAAGEGKTSYAPMKPFEPYAGKVWRGEGKDPAGKPVVDIAEWEFTPKPCSWKRRRAVSTIR